MSKILHPTIYKDDNLELFLETHPHWGVLIHCYVYSWSRCKYEEFLHIWDEVLEQLCSRGYENIYAAVLREDRRLKKFSTMFGFTSTGTYLRDTDNNEREVFICLT